MPQVLKTRPPSGRSRKRKLLQGEPDEEEPVQQTFELWVDKYLPKLPSELVVHSKKVNDVRAWLTSRLEDPGWRVPGGQLLILTGPPGVGKSAVIRTLGNSMGLEFFEWTTPTPTPWQEHLHHGFTGQRYTSKLDEFETFLENARKFPLLPISSSSGPSKPKVLLIEDLPLVNDAPQTQQLCNLLNTLVRSTLFITVVIITDVAEERLWGHREALQTLEGAGATKIVFNPVTANAIKKLLTKIASREKCSLLGSSIAAIAENCSGDLRHAISSLQFQCCLSSLNSFQFGDTSKDGVVRKASFERGTGSSPAYGRDNIFSLYHALGKFLHNKRHNEQPAEGTQESTLVLHEDFRRHPLNMEVPERIVAESQLEFPTLVAFLHENVVDFVDDDGIEDVADVLAYLADADVLLGRHPRNFGVSLSHVAASSVATRGVLFANTHPAPRKWQSVRAPMLWQVERLVAEKKDSMSSRLPATRNLPEYVEDEDVPMDDVNSLTADCIVDLDDFDDSSPLTDSQVHVYRRASDGAIEEDAIEDEIEDDDDD